MKSIRRTGRWALAGLVALEIVTGGPGLGARRELSEQELNARIEQENNPAKKAKLEIQLGNLKLNEAIAAYDHDQFEAGPRLLETYRSLMNQAWDLLEKSGRDAGRKPQGFKDLDIALREHARRLNDLRQRTPLADRAAIEHVTADIDGLHAQVLTALFPGGQLKEPAPASQAKPGRPAPAIQPKGPKS